MGEHKPDRLNTSYNLRHNLSAGKASFNAFEPPAPLFCAQWHSENHTKNKSAKIGQIIKMFKLYYNIRTPKAPTLVNYMQTAPICGTGTPSMQGITDGCVLSMKEITLIMRMKERRSISKK